MKNTTRTQVGRSHPLVKAMIALLCPAWKGRKVTVIEAGPGWSHTVYHGDVTRAWLRSSTEAPYACVMMPTYSQPACVTMTVQPGQLLVIHSVFQGVDCGIEIVIPAPDAGTRSMAFDSVCEQRRDSESRAFEGLRAHVGAGSHYCELILAALKVEAASLRKASAQAVAS